MLDIHLDRPPQGLRVKVNIPPGITAVFGPSGSGKTTLFRAISGLEPHATGTIWLGLEQWLGAGPLKPLHRRGIGYCFQDSRVLPHLSVRGNLEYGARAKWLRRDAWSPPIPRDEIIERLELTPLLRRTGRRLSGGEARRVALARAMLCSRTLLLLDEPFVGLEEHLAGAVTALISDFHIRSGISVLLATHDACRGKRLSQRTLRIENGVGHFESTASAREAS